MNLAQAITPCGVFTAKNDPFGAFGNPADMKSPVNVSTSIALKTSCQEIFSSCPVSEQQTCVSKVVFHFEFSIEATFVPHQSSFDETLFVAAAPIGSDMFSLFHKH